MAKIIGIAGGTASGKTTIAKRLKELAEPYGKVAMLRLDDYYKDMTFKCMHYHGTLNVVTAIAKSCNYFFYEVGNRIGIDTLSSYLTDLKDGLINRLCVAMPPRHSKSSLITLAFPLWLITRDPSLNIMVIRQKYNVGAFICITL